MVDAAEECDWEGRVQDWIDGDLDSAGSAAVAEHAASCAICGRRLVSLRTLDADLSVTLSRQTLDEAFDRRVLKAVAESTKADRSAARARIERERQAQIATLSHGWRRVWRSIILNGLAAISLFAALAVPIRLLPGYASFVSRMLSLTQYSSLSTTVALSVAAASSALAFIIVRALSFAERG